MFKVIDVPVFTKSQARPNTQPIQDRNGIKRRPPVFKKYEVPKKPTITNPNKSK